MLTVALLRAWARAIRRDTLALWLAARDARVPCGAKVVAALVAAYALSPIDLIPDFIPVLGYLDELIVLPLGILLAVKLSPADLMAELREEATCHSKPISRTGFLLVVVVWVALAAALVWLFLPEAAIFARP